MSIPQEYIPAVEKGIQEQLDERRARRLSGGRHQGDAVRRLVPRGRLDEMAFKIAGSMAFKEGCAKASPVLLEPIMKVEVVTPGGLHGRRRSAT